jgi:Fe-S-cluster containining protein
MRLILDTDGKVNYDEININTTVYEVLEAVNTFLKDNPLPCNKCIDSCCRKSWSVEMDNVCVNRLSGWKDEVAVEFVKDGLIKKKNYYRDFTQFVLKKETHCNFITEKSLCSIYNERPIICRLYMCTSKSYRYNVVRELIASTYLKALVLEDKMRNNNFTERTIKKYRRNPAVFAEDYDISLAAIFNYAQEEGWLDEDEREELYKR